MKTTLFLIVLSVMIWHANASGDDEHEHPFEWAGSFETPEDMYTWIAQADDEGAYADPTMEIAIIAIADDELEEATLEIGEEVLNTTVTPCTSVSVGGTLDATTSKCYLLVFDEQLTTSVYKINTTGADHVAIFAQHLPTEFERDTHFLKDVDGEDIEAVHTYPEEEGEDSHHDDKPWGETMGASFTVMLCTLIGVIFLAPQLTKIAKENIRLVTGLTNAFAAGALLAAAFFLMLYEATHLIVRDEEAESSGIWGAMVLLGFITPFILELLLGFFGVKYFHKHNPVAVTASDDENEADNAQNADNRSNYKGEKIKDKDDLEVVDMELADVERGSTDVDDSDADDSKEKEIRVLKDHSIAEAEPHHRMRVLSGILLGDFLHNLVDGVFIGAAFNGCDSSTAWTITAATIYHELAQELSDFFVLTNKAQGNLSAFKALLFNFCSGFSVILGAIIVLASEPSNETTGILLAYGAGVYMQIAATECMPRVHAISKTTKLRLVCLTLFIIGALTIGLVLLDHEHCSGDSGEEGGDAHAGHAH